LTPSRRAPLICGAAIALTIPAGPLGPAAAAAPSPAPARPGVAVEPGGAAIGTGARVRGSAWTPGATVQIQVCGANAVHGSADCDTERGVTAMVAPAGTFAAGLTVGGPPSACPCVMRVTTLPGTPGTPASVTVPFTVVGHRVGVILEDVVPVRADIVDAELTGGGGWGERFGGRPHRTLVLTVRNAGPEPIVDAPLTIGWGSGKVADSPLDTPRTGRLGPGRTATYRVPVALPPASFGRFVVGGRYAASVPFETSFSTYPWGLLGANALALALFLLGLRIAFGRWAGRRRASRAAGLAPTHDHVTASRCASLDADDLLGYLDATARDPSGAYRIDREALAGYLRRRTAGPIDPAALERFLDIDRFAREEE